MYNMAYHMHMVGIQLAYQVLHPLRTLLPWVRHAASLDETTTLPPDTCVSASLVARIIDEEMAALGRTLGPANTIFEP